MSICLLLGDADLDHLAKMVSARPFHFKITIFPFVTHTYLRGDKWRLGEYFSSKFCPVVLAFAGRHCLQQFLLWCISIPVIISTFINWKSYVLSFIYLFNYLLWTGGCLLYSIYYNPIYHYLFRCSTCFSFGCWELFQFVSCDFVTSSNTFLSTFLLSGTPSSRLIIFFFLPPPLEPTSSTRTSGFLYRKMTFRNKDLGSRYVHYYWDSVDSIRGPCFCQYNTVLINVT